MFCTFCFCALKPCSDEKYKSPAYKDTQDPKTVSVLPEQPDHIFCLYLFIFPVVVFSMGSSLI